MHTVFCNTILYCCFCFGCSLSFTALRVISITYIHTYVYVCVYVSITRCVYAVEWHITLALERTFALCCLPHSARHSAFTICQGRFAFTLLAVVCRRHTLYFHLIFAFCVAKSAFSFAWFLLGANYCYCCCCRWNFAVLIGQRLFNAVQKCWAQRANK